jgi:hypothetical protein
LNRRHFLAASAAIPLASFVTRGMVPYAQAQPVAFDPSVVRQMARDAAPPRYF